MRTRDSVIVRGLLALTLGLALPACTAAVGMDEESGDGASGNGSLVGQSAGALSAAPEGERVAIRAAGQTAPVMWVKLSLGDQLIFTYGGKSYVYTEAGEATELDPVDDASDLIVSGNVSGNCEIAMPGYMVDGKKSPHLLVVNGNDVEAPAFALSSCTSASCLEGTTREQVNGSYSNPIAADTAAMVRFFKDTASADAPRVAFALSKAIEAGGHDPSDDLDLWVTQTSASTGNTTTQAATTTDQTTTSTSSSEPTSVVYTSAASDTASSSDNGDSGMPSWLKWTLIIGGVATVAYIGYKIWDNNQQEKEALAAQQRQQALWEQQQTTLNMNYYRQVYSGNIETTKDGVKYEGSLAGYEVIYGNHELPQPTVSTTSGAAASK